MYSFYKIYEYGCLMTPDVKVIRISDDEQHNDHLTKNFNMNLRQAFQQGWLRYRDESNLFDASWDRNSVSAASLERLIDIILHLNVQTPLQFVIGRQILDFDTQNDAIAFLEHELHNKSIPMAA